MKLYQANGSPNSRRVRIYLAEKGFDADRAGRSRRRRNNSPSLIPRSIRAASFRPLCSTTARDRRGAGHPALSRGDPSRAAAARCTPKEKALVTMWERRVEQEGFASVMEAVRNAVAGLKGRAIAGPHDYEQIPALVERSKARVGNFYAISMPGWREPPSLQAMTSRSPTSPHLSLSTSPPKRPGLQCLRKLSALRRWHDGVSARPSMAA